MHATQVATPVQTPAPQAPAPQAAPENASLYVGELDQSVTEAILFELFNPLGAVASIRDAITRRSLGYAYVNFHSAADGERAMQELNYHPLRNSPIRIMWSQRDPSSRRTGSGNVFIKNLDVEVDNKALHETFSVFGHILSCKIVSDDNGPKGYGFVHFQEVEAADAAIASVNGMLINDRKVFVGHHISKKDRQSSIIQSQSRFTNIFVKNIDVSVTEADFLEMCSKHGVITSGVLSKDADGVSRGFGFVNYEKCEEAAAAVSALNELEICGKPLYVGRAQLKSERDTALRQAHLIQKQNIIAATLSTNLFIKNIDEEITEDQLRQEFSPFGSIISCRIMRAEEEPHTSKGFGFVCFSSSDESTKAVAEMHGKMIGTKPIYVAIAQRKEARRQYLAQQIQQRNQMRMQQVAQGTPLSNYKPQMQGTYPAPMFFQQGPPQQQQQMRQGFFPQQQQQMRPQRNNFPAQQQQQQQMNYSVQQQQQFQGQRQPLRPYQQDNQQMQQAQQQMLEKTVYKYGGSQVRKAPTQVRKLDTTQLLALTPEEQKRMLGDFIFPMVANLTKDAEGMASKITGMMLEMGTQELLDLIESEDNFKENVAEARAVLETVE